MHPDILALSLAYALIGALGATILMLLISFVSSNGDGLRKPLYVLVALEVVLLGAGAATQTITLSPAQAIEDIGADATIEVHERMIFVMGKIDTMPDDAVTALVMNRPEFASEVDRVVNAIDPDNTRATDPEMARRALRRYAALSRRNAEQLQVWETTIAEYGRATRH